MGVYSEAILFWGLAFKTPHQAPWHESTKSPEDPALDWQNRLQRHAPEAQGEELEQCSVEIYDSFDNQRYFVCITESVSRCEDTDSITIPRTNPKPEWEAQLKRFCERLDIPWSKANWKLTTQLVH